MSKISIDGDARIMTILPGVTEIDVQKDIYSEYAVWIGKFNQGIANAGFEQAMYYIGGEDLGEGQQAPVYYFLINDWKLSLSTGETVTIGYNLYSLNNDRIVCITSNNSQVKFNNSSAVLISADAVINLLNQIKNKTDLLNFVAGDVVATLDGEEVTLDEQSKKDARAKATISL